jgi:hypothetical protein
MKESYMQRSEPENNSSQRLARTTCALSGVLMAFWIVGCGSNTNSSMPATPQQAPQSYFAPYVEGINNISPSPQIYILDDVAKAFSQETFVLNPTQVGPQVFTAGDFTVNQRGLQSLGILTTYGTLNSSGENTGVYVPVNYPAPGLPGSFAVELAGQAGGLVQLAGGPAEPLVAATQCPGSTSQTYRFITIPEPTSSWNPSTDTAYGSVDISSSGSTVNFQNIHQNTLAGTLLPPSALPVTGACGPTILGAVTGIPGQYIVKNPGATSSITPPQAAVGIGPTGLLVEDNDNGGEEVLGAGTGAVGLPKPSSALDTGAVVGAQYLGFIFGAGASNSEGSVVAPLSSHLASFGFSADTLPSSCAAFAAQTGKLVNGIYGGDFQHTNGLDNPSLSPDGFGNCDFAIDLGIQDPLNNGLYPNATVWVGGAGARAIYAGNVVGSTYSFSAVAIAGQLNGKYAIFLIGNDSTQPWAIYLLQSN